MIPSRLRILFFAASAIFLAVPAFADPGPTVAAPRHTSVEALLSLPPSPVEAPKAVAPVEAPQACPEPALDAPPAASPAQAWASAMRAFAER